MKKTFFDNRGLAVRTSLALGYSPIAEMLLPTERIERRVYHREEDFIPFLLAPTYVEIAKRDRWGEIVDQRRVVSGLSNDAISLDFSQGGFVSLFISPSGAGKTFALRGLLDTLVEYGYAVIIFDVKSEFVSSMKPVQDKFLHLLPPWRTPKNMPVCPIFPAYLKKKNLPKNWVGQLDVKDMKVEDMLTALELKPNDAQSQILFTVWRDENSPKTLDRLIWRVSRVNASQVLQTMVPKGVKLQPFAERTQSTLIRKLMVLKFRKVFGSENPFDVIELLKQNYVVDVCLDEDDRKRAYHSTYIAVLVRKVYDECRRIGKRVVFVFEDMGNFALPGKSDPSCKEVIMNQLIPVGRKRGLYIIGAVQNLSQLPDEAQEQARTFVFFGRVSGLDLEKMAKVRKMRYKLIREKMAEYQRYAELPDGRRGCVVWDEKGRASLGFVCAPSSMHAEQER